jgi:hypothetical protein
MTLEELARQTCPDEQHHHKYPATPCESCETRALLANAVMEATREHMLAGECSHIYGSYWDDCRDDIAQRAARITSLVRNRSPR